MSAQPNLGMQPTTFDNPMGIDGFEFVEFAAPAGQAQHLHDYFRRMGFTQVRSLSGGIKARTDAGLPLVQR